MTEEGRQAGNNCMRMCAAEVRVPIIAGGKPDRVESWIGPVRNERSMHPVKLQP